MARVRRGTQGPVDPVQASNQRLRDFAMAQAERARVGTPGGAIRPVHLDREEAQEPDADGIERRFLRYRRHDPVKALWRDGSVGAECWLAAEWFRDLHALAEGARESSGTPGGLAAWQKGSYAAAQLDAVAVRHHVVARVIGLRLSAVFVAVVLECEPMRLLDRRHRLRNGSAADLAVEALNLLAAYHATVEAPAGPDAKPLDFGDSL